MTIQQAFQTVRSVTLTLLVLRKLQRGHKKLFYASPFFHYTKTTHTHDFVTTIEMVVVHHILMSYP